jgi:GxxExxY protein
MDKGMVNLPDLLSSGLTGQIIGAAIDVHKELGPGLLESVYELCMAKELASRGLAFQTQVPVPIVYKGEVITEAAPLRIDMLVEDTVVVELKSVEKVIPIHEVKLTTYLRLTGKRVGLIINFNVAMLKEGITRRVV